MQSTLTFLVNGPAGTMMRGGHGGFFLGGVMSLLWTVAIVLLVLWVTRHWSSITSYFRRSTASVQANGAPTVTSQTPLEILQVRYAKGEITREEYDTMRHDLGGERAPAPAV